MMLDIDFAVKLPMGASGFWITTVLFPLSPTVAGATWAPGHVRQDQETLLIVTTGSEGGEMLPAPSGWSQGGC